MAHQAERLDEALVPPSSVHSQDHRELARNASARVGVALVVGWLVLLWHQSRGTPMQDEFLHTVISRSAWSDPRWLIDSWGRPVNTILYAVPSLFGIFGVRLAALLMSAGAVGLSLRLGRRLGLSNTVLVPLMFAGQQLFDRHAFIGLTQVPFMLGITLLSVLILEDRRVAVALVAGLLPLIRAEGALLTAGIAVVFLRRRQWREFAILASPYLLYLASHWLLVGAGPATGATDAKPTTFYGHGSWSTEADHLTHGVGLVILVLSACSTPVILRRPRMAFIVFAYPISYFLAHVVISRFGLFAYGSLPVYLLPVTPSIAISAALGLESVGRVLGRTLKPELPSAERKVRTACAVTVPLVVCLALTALALTRGLATRPWAGDAEAVSAARIVAAVRQVRPDVHQVVATHAYVQYEWGRPLPWTRDRERTRLGTIPKVSLQDVRPGGVFIWDGHYSPRAGVHLAELRRDPSWQEVASYRGFMIAFRRVA